MLSLFDKTGLYEIARRLKALKFRLIGSRGTARDIRKAGIRITDIASISGFPPILDHRVVTLCPAVHAGILAKHTEKHEREMALVGASRIKLIYVNFYPLLRAIEEAGATLASIMESFDIGGPTMVRSGIKTAPEGTIVVCDPTDMEWVLTELEITGEVSLEYRLRLAAKAMYLITCYDVALMEYLGKGQYVGIVGEFVRSHRYGENPNQTPSGLYTQHTPDPLALDQFTCAGGGDLGYVNDTDLDRLLQTLTHIAATFKQNGRGFLYYAVGDKHGNSCGGSYGNDKLTVLRNMIRGNLRAIWGGMIITNFTIGIAEAEILRTYMVKKKKRILDGVFAPKITAEAIAILERPKGACKMLVNPALATPKLDTARWFRRVRGGLLIQPNFTYIFRFDNKSVEYFGQLSRAQKDNILFAAAICQTSNSNTTTLVLRRMLIGNGMTRPDRCDATTLSVTNAREQGHNTNGAVAVTDSFFPFPDAPQVLIDAGISTILTVSGSLGDAIVKKTITEADVTLIWLPVSEGRMFFGH